MTALTLAFITGYLAYAAAFWGQAREGHDLIVPIVFFAGACFVWMSCRLSLQSVNDMRRVILLERESITDPLSGIYNRRYLERRLEEEFTRVQRYGTPLSILLIDIDHFKEVNDRFGHQAGDLVLSYLGKLILNGIRASDIAARYGGDELMIISPNTSLALAGALAERLRSQIEAHALILSSEPGQRHEINITVSIGVAACSDGTCDGHALIEQVDAGLYHAKSSGRNRVFVQGLH
jgi:diguanylate cyclase (GGDEF)-like protein